MTGGRRFHLSVDVLIVGAAGIVSCLGRVLDASSIGCAQSQATEATTATAFSHGLSLLLICYQPPLWPTVLPISLYSRLARLRRDFPGPRYNNQCHAHLALAFEISRVVVYHLFSVPMCVKCYRICADWVPAQEKVQQVSLTTSSSFYREFLRSRRSYMRHNTSSGFCQGNRITVGLSTMTRQPSVIATSRVRLPNGLTIVMYVRFTTLDLR